MKKLYEASVAFEAFQREDGSVVVAATLNADTIKNNATSDNPEEVVEAPISDLFAAAAYKMFNDGVLHEVIRIQFGAQIGEPNGA